MRGIATVAAAACCAAVVAAYLYRQDDDRDPALVAREVVAESSIAMGRRILEKRRLDHEDAVRESRRAVLGALREIGRDPANPRFLPEFRSASRLQWCGAVVLAAPTETTQYRWISTDAGAVVAPAKHVVFHPESLPAAVRATFEDCRAWRTRDSSGSAP